MAPKSFVSIDWHYRGPEAGIAVKGSLKGVGGAVCLFGLSAGAKAQFGSFLGVSRALELVFRQSAPTVNPLLPQASEPLPPKSPLESTAGQKLPPAPDPQGKFEIIGAGDIIQDGDVANLSGGAEFVYEGYHVLADNASWNRITHVANLFGNVKITSADTVIKGERVTIDFDHSTYQSHNAEAQISPKDLGGRVKGFIYAKGENSFGSKVETRTFNSDFTSCNKEEPHYSIGGDDTTVRPGKRIIFRRAKLRLFGRTVFRLPFLSIPLDNRNYKNLPEVGYSTYEGYYVKTNYSIPLPKNHELRTRLDYFSKLGVGYGLGYGYESRRTNGFLQFYSISGPADSLQLSNQHRQVFSWGSVVMDTDYQKNNYLSSPGSTILSNRLTVDLPGKRGNDRLSYSRSSQDSANYGTVNQTLTLADTRKIGTTGETNLNLSYIDSSSKSTSTHTDSQQLDVLFKASEDTPKGLASLEYQRAIPIGSEGSFFSGSDRTPVLNFSSDSDKLLGKKFSNFLPFRTDFSFGEFQNFDGSHVTRQSADFNFQKSDRSNKPLKSDFTGEFRQGIYSDDTAQYILAFGNTTSYSLGRDSSANFRYNYLRPYGYSPLSQDQTGRTNLASVDLSYRVIPSLLFAGQTSYDITRLQDQLGTPWQQVGIRSEFRPSKNFQARSLATYDTYQQAWSNVRIDSGYQSGQTLVTIGALYDGIRHTWSTTNLFLNNLKIGKTLIGATLSYNGYTQQFDSQQYNFIYDLHCAEAVLTWSEFNTGFRPGRTINFFIRLKAFSFDSAFGLGQRGQPLGTGTGRDF